MNNFWQCTNFRKFTKKNDLANETVLITNFLTTKVIYYNTFGSLLAYYTNLYRLLQACIKIFSTSQPTKVSIIYLAEGGKPFLS